MRVAPVLLISLVFGCGAASPTTQTPAESPPTVHASGRAADGSLVGVLTREQLLADERFAEAFASASASADAGALVDTPPAPVAQIEVVLATWCPDSRREVSQLFRDLDAVSFDHPRFGLRLVGVDRSRAAPDGLTDGLGVRFVPTFIVRIGGREVGRVVEAPPAGMTLSAALAGLMRGEISGPLGRVAP